MNSLQYIQIIVFLLSCGSNGDTGQPKMSASLKRGADTSIGVSIVPIEISGPQYLKKEYYVVVNTDTSSFSCIISKNKVSGKLTMQCKDSPNGKAPSSVSLSDTAILSTDESSSKSYPEVFDGKQIPELQLIFDHVSKEYDLSKLKSLRFAISLFHDFARNVTSKYVSQFNGKVHYGSSEKVVDIIEESQLKADINHMLSQYSLTIGKSNVDALLVSMPNHSKQKQTPVLDGIVIFNLVEVP